MGGTLKINNKTVLEVKENGVIVFADGSRVLKGELILSNGFTIRNDGVIRAQDGSVVLKLSEAHKYADGVISLADGSTVLKNGTVLFADGCTSLADGVISLADGS